MKNNLTANILKLAVLFSITLAIFVIHRSQAANGAVFAQCANHAVFEQCIASADQQISACGSNDFTCLCLRAGEKLRCYEQCPNDNSIQNERSVQTATVLAYCAVSAQQQ
jgi:hypothetical protein